MEAGPLNRQITFQEPKPSRDEYGQDNQTWRTVCTVWASVRPLSGRQLALAQANTTTSTATHDIRIRYRPDLRGQVNYRIRYGSVDAPRYFRINAILNVDEGRAELRITATEVVA